MFKLLLVYETSERVTLALKLLYPVVPVNPEALKAANKKMHVTFQIPFFYEATGQTEPAIAEEGTEYFEIGQVVYCPNYVKIWLQDHDYDEHADITETELLLMGGLEWFKEDDMPYDTDPDWEEKTPAWKSFAEMLGRPCSIVDE